MFQIITVQEGQRVAIWDLQGRVRYVDGPQRLFLWYKRVQYLDRFSAHADQYLAVEFVDGHCEHVRGPATIWQDPIEHKEVQIRDAMPLDSNEAVVVYRRDNGDVHRRVERGPMLFIPSEDEWLHWFRWHGSDPHNPLLKVPEALQFSKLRVIPDQMYCHVEDVRTSDDALLTVKLMIFFELVDIEKMLDQTHDPTADFLNAVTADIIDFVASRSFEDFKMETERLNDLETYANLATRTSRIGYQVNKVVYRGYKASSTLQSMHDGAIEARTQLKLEAETESQAQDLADLKQQRQAVRQQQDQIIQREQAEHEVQLKRLDHDETMRQDLAQSKAQMDTQRERNEIELQRQQALNQEKTKALGSMREMQVDLTRYLVAQYQHPDRLIRIAGDSQSQVHLHQDT